MSLVYKSPWDTTTVAVYTGRNVGVGVDNPKEKLEVNGAFRLLKMTKGKDSLADGTVFYDGTDLLAMVGGEIDTLTDGGTEPPPVEQLWTRILGSNTVYTFYNVGINTNDAQKPLQIQGRIDSLPTIRFSHKYITGTVNQEEPLFNIDKGMIPKNGDTIIRNADIVSSQGCLFFNIDGYPADFGFSHSTMHSRVKFLCEENIISKKNVFIYQKVSIGNGGSIVPDDNFYVNGTSRMDGSLAVGDNVKIYPDGKMWVRNQIKVNLDKPESWGDFIFEPNYKLKPLSEVEAYVKEHKHLEGIPSANELVKDGIDLGAMTNILTQKLEEMTLYMIEMNKTIELLKKENEELRKEIRKTN
jgi:hypothetical protein